MTTLDTDQLTDLIRRKHRCLERLRDLGRRQLRLIEDGNMTELLTILSAKQQLISQLDAIQRDLVPYGRQSREERRWRSEADRSRCAKAIEACDAMFAEIVAQEKQGEEQLRRRRDDVSARLDGAHQTGQAHHAYTAIDPRQASQIDLSSEGGKRS